MDVEASQTSPVANNEQLLQIICMINFVASPVPCENQLSRSESLSRSPPRQVSPDNLSTLKSGFSSPPTKDFLGVLSSTLAPPNLDKVSGSSSYQSPSEDSDCQVQEIRPRLPLQLFSLSPENDSLPNVTGARKYFSSDSSNPIDEISPSSSPPVTQKMFLIQASREIELERVSGRGEVKTNVGYLEHFGGLDGGDNSGSCQTLPNKAGYTSSSGSDHSPSSLISDARDRTGRIAFKLFGKDPSHLPETLRSQLEQNLMQYVNSLIRDPDTDFWRSGRFLVQAARQLVLYNNGKLCICKSVSAPEIICMSPMAIVAGQEATLLIKWHNLNIPGTRIHCTNGGHLLEEVQYDEISFPGFRT